jgi:asparagine synthase (glutamine-hydrolysing)
LKASLPAMPKVVLKKALYSGYDDLKYLNKDFVNSHVEHFDKHASRKITGLNNGLAQEYFEGQLQLLLRCEDRASMHFSIESRTPFADDKDLIELMFSIAGPLKIRNGQSKWLLREAIKGIVPENVRTRKDKKGFAAPTNLWLKELKSDFKDLILNPEMSQYFDIKTLSRDFDMLFSPTSEIENYRVYKLMAFAVWHNVFSSLNKP